MNQAIVAVKLLTGLPVFNQMKEIMGDQLSYVHSGDEVKNYSLL